MSVVGMSCWMGLCLWFLLWGRGVVVVGGACCDRDAYKISL